MPILQLLSLAAEEGGEVAPYLVGGGALVLLVLALLGILAFGKGREHS
jgi:hypothetical protein